MDRTKTTVTSFLTQVTRTYVIISGRFSTLEHTTIKGYRYSQNYISILTQDFISSYQSLDGPMFDSTWRSLDKRAAVEGDRLRRYP